MSTGTRSNVTSSSSAEPALPAGVEPGPGLFCRILALCAATGVLGVLFGYAGFMLFWEETERGHPWQFAIALAIAGFFALIVEGMRELIQHGALRISVYWPPSRLIVTLLMLTVFELFVMAGHSVFAKSWQWLHEAAQSIVGPALSESSDAGLDLCIVGGLWVVIGAGLAGCLGTLIFQRPADLRRQIHRGMWTGGLAGMIGAPLILLAYILVVRFFGGLHMFFFAHARWTTNLKNLESHLVDSGNFFVVLGRLGLKCLKTIDGLWEAGWWGPVLVGIIVAAIVITCIRKKFYLPLFVLGWSPVAIILLPLLAGLDKVFTMLVLAALIWGLPGIVLGAFVPLLRQPSQTPRLWAPIAFVAAAILICLTLLRLLQWWFLFPSALLLATGFLLEGGRRVEEYWPLVALSIATIVCGMTALWQQATFSGVFERIHLVLGAPADIQKKPAPYSPLAGMPSEFSARTLNSLRSLGSLNLPNSPQSPRPWLSQDLATLFPPKTAPRPSPRITLLTPEMRETLQQYEEERALQDLHEKAVQYTKQMEEQIRTIEESQKIASDRTTSQLCQLDGKRQDLSALSLHEKPQETKALLASYGQILNAIKIERANIESSTAECQKTWTKLAEEFNDTAPRLLPETDLNLQYAAARERCATARDKLTKTLADADDAVKKREAEVHAIVEDLHQQEIEADRKLQTLATQGFEMIVTGSLGFWVTVGLLAAWKVWNA